MVYLHNGQMTTGTSRKLRNKKFGPCKILKKRLTTPWSLRLATAMTKLDLLMSTSKFTFKDPIGGGNHSAKSESP